MSFVIFNMSKDHNKYTIMIHTSACDTKKKRKTLHLQESMKWFTLEGGK